MKLLGVWSAQCIQAIENDDDKNGDNASGSQSKSNSLARHPKRIGEKRRKCFHFFSSLSKWFVPLRYGAEEKGREITAHSNSLLVVSIRFRQMKQNFNKHIHFWMLLKQLRSQLFQLVSGKKMVNGFVVLSTTQSHTCNFDFSLYFLLFSK